MSILRNAFDQNIVDQEQANFLQEQADAQGMGALRRGWNAGRVGGDLNAARIDEAAALAAGDAQKAALLGQQREHLEQRQALYAPDVAKVEDIRGLGDALSWAGTQMGQGAASTADPVALSAVGTALGRLPGPFKLAPLAAGVGTLALNQRQLAGEHVGRLREDPTAMANLGAQGVYDQANMVGLAGAALDTVPQFMIGRALGGAALRQGASGMMGRSFGGKLAGGMAMGSATEVSQGEIGRYMHSQANAARDTSGDWSDRLNEAAGGAVGDAPFSAAGAAADMAYGGTARAGEAVKDKAGTVIDMTAEKAQQVYEDTGIKGAVDLGVDGAKSIYEKAAEFGSKVKDYARDASGKINYAETLKRAKADIDRYKMSEEEFTLLTEVMPPDLPPDQQVEWVNQKFDQRSEHIFNKLTDLEQQGVAEATPFVDRMTSDDPVERTQAVDEASNFLLERNAAARVRERSALYQVALGGFIQRSAKEFTRGAKAVGDAAVFTGINAAEGVRQGLSKKNMQRAGGEKTGPLDYETWRQFRQGSLFDDAGARYTRVFSESEQKHAIARANEAFERAGEKPIKTDPEAAARSLERATLFAEIMAAEAQARILRTNSYPGVGQDGDLSDFARYVAFEIADMASTWGSRAGQTARPTARDKAQAEVSISLLDSMADDIIGLLGDAGSDVISRMAQQEPPESQPFFELLQERVQNWKVNAPERAAREQNVRDQMVALLPQRFQTDLLKDKGAGARQLYDAVGAIARGLVGPEKRAEIEKFVPRETLNQMLTLYGSTVPDKGGKGVSGWASGDDSEAFDADRLSVDDDGEVVEGASDFEKNMGEKALSRGGVGQKRYGHSKSPSMREDPFAPAKRLTKEERQAFINEDRARRAAGEPGVVYPEAERPKLFTKGQKNFDGSDAIERRIEAMSKKLGPDFSVTARSAQDVMDANKTHPASRLAIFRDYMSVLARDESQPEEVRAVASSRMKRAQAALLDALDDPESASGLRRNKVAMTDEQQAPSGLSKPGAVEQWAEGMLQGYEAKGGVRQGKKEVKDKPQARLTAGQRKELYAAMENYFRSRYIVEAERQIDRESSKIDAVEIRQMIESGRKGYDVMREEHGDGTDALNAAASESNLLWFESTLHDERTDKKAGDVPISANALVGWVRKQRSLSEEYSGNDEGLSNRDKNDAFLSDLYEGISILMNSGFMTGKMPHLIGPDGKNQSFADGVPESLLLETTTGKGHAFARGERIKKVPKHRHVGRGEDARDDMQYQRVRDRELAQGDDLSDGGGDDAAEMEIGEHERSGMDPYGDIRRKKFGNRTWVGGYSAEQKALMAELEVARKGDSSLLVAVLESKLATSLAEGGAARADTLTEETLSIGDAERAEAAYLRGGKRERTKELNRQDTQRAAGLRNNRIDAWRIDQDNEKHAIAAARRAAAAEGLELGTPEYREFVKDLVLQRRTDRSRDSAQVLAEKTDLSMRSKQVDSGLGPEPKITAKRFAKDRAGAILETFRREGTDKGMEALERRLRMAKEENTDPSKGMVGGAHYAWPLTHILNQRQVSGMNMVAGDPTLNRLAAMRSELVMIIHDARDISMPDKVAMVKAMSSEEGAKRVNAANVMGMLAGASKQAREAAEAKAASKAAPKAAPEVAAAEAPKSQSSPDGAVKAVEREVLEVLRARRPDKQFAVPNDAQLNTISAIVARLPEALREAASTFGFVIERGKNRGMAYTETKTMGIDIGAIRDDARWAAGMTPRERMGWVVAHELGHVADADKKFALSSGYPESLMAEARTAMGKNPMLDWVLDYPLNSGVKSPTLEMVAQLAALHAFKPEILNEHLPKNAAWIRRALGTGQAGRADADDAAGVGVGARRDGRNARDDGPVVPGRQAEQKAQLNPGGAAKAGFKLTPTTTHTQKDQLKANRATKFIGRGSERSSTNSYANDAAKAGVPVNAGTYTASDVVFVSAEGNRTGRVAPDLKEIDKAIQAGATILTDNAENRQRAYNVGEREVEQHLLRSGYVERSPGEWGTTDAAAHPITKIVSGGQTGVDIAGEDRQLSQAEVLRQIEDGAARVRRTAPKPSGAEGRDLGTIPMYYKMPATAIRQELRAQYPNGTTTAQLMTDGHRTATTRRVFGKVGDTFTVDGIKYRITALEKVDLDTAAGRAKWSQREGWDVDYVQRNLSGQVYTGATQTVFERVGPARKLNAQGTLAAGVAADMMSTREVMRQLGFKAAPEQFADVAAKLLVSPDVDPDTFIKQSAEGISHLLMGGDSGGQIRGMLQSDYWRPLRYKIAAKLMSDGMDRGDALVASYRMITRMALTKELTERGVAAKSFIGRVTQLAKDLTSKFRKFTQTEKFEDLVRNNLNRLIEKSAKPIDLKANYRRVSFQDAVDADPQSARVLAHMSKLPGAMITGSIVLAANGTIYRNAANMLHDLDVLISGSKEAAKEYLVKAFPGAVQIYDFQTSNAKIDTFIVPPAGAQVRNIVRANGDKGRLRSYEVVRDGKVVGRTWNDQNGEHKTGEAGTLVDLMSEHKAKAAKVIPFTVDGKQYQMPAPGAEHIFTAKLGMGRDKDLNDYLRFVPNTGRKLNAQGTVDPRREALIDEFMNSPSGEAMGFDPTDRDAREEVRGMFDRGELRSTPQGKAWAKLGEAPSDEQLLGDLPEAPADTQGGVGVDEDAGLMLDSEPETPTEAPNSPEEPPKPAGDTQGTTEAKKRATAGVATDEEIKLARAYFDKVLGRQIRAEFHAITGFSGEWIEAENLIFVSTLTGAGTMNVARHEALHAFWSKFVQNNPKALRVLTSLTDDPRILQRLQVLLKDEPAALAQLADGEERLAYIYQFAMAGLLKLPHRPGTTLMHKVRKFLRRAFQMISDQERAVDLLYAFEHGKLREPSAAGRVVAKTLAQGTALKRGIRAIDGLAQWTAAQVLPANTVLSESPSATARALAKMFYTNPGEEGAADEGQGYLNARNEKMRSFSNLFRAAIDGLDKPQLDALTELMQLETPTKDIADPDVANAKEELNALFARFHKYLTEEKGLRIGEIKKDYFPVVYNPEAVRSKGLDKLLLGKYRADIDAMVEAINRNILKENTRREAKGQGVEELRDKVTAEEVVGAIVNHITRDNPTDDAEMEPKRQDGVLRPWFGAGERRVLSFLSPEDRAPFQEKDIVTTLSRYVRQGVRAAEYSSRFGRQGKALAQMLSKAEAELVEASHQMLKEGELKNEKARKKWAERQYRDVARAAGAMEGSLGHDVGEFVRKANSAAVVYQNIRLLPLALFSSFVDPLGIIARGGEMRLAYEAFTRGLRGVVQQWGDMLHDEPAGRGKDKWEQLAELAGVIDAATFSHLLTDEYGSVYMDSRATKINEVMFKANGMEAWNRGMRVGATKAAAAFMVRHNRGKDEHSARWMRDLGFEVGQLLVDEDGNMLTDKREVVRAKPNWTMEEAEDYVAKTHAAITRWVESAIMSPNAAQRPAWGSDPHYGMFWHLKQFAYSFHTTMIKRAVNEASYGNYSPLGVFAWYIPTMVASDIVKNLALGAGELPAYMKGYDMGDWVMHGVDRSGVLGVGHLAIEGVQDPTSLAGPMVEQIKDIYVQPAKESIIKALPANALYGRWLK